MIEVFPEDIIWEYVSQRLEGLRDLDLSHRKYYSQFPLTIDLSTEFLSYWSMNVRKAVQKKTVETFGFRQVLFLENDQAKRYSAANPEFWRNSPLQFSRRAPDRIWEDIVGKVHEKKPAWLLVTPADALFLSILEPKLFETYSFDWLFTNKASWLVLALFIFHKKFENLRGFPFRAFFDKQDIVPLPVREILIQQIALYFENAIDASENLLRRLTTNYSGRNLTSAAVISSPASEFPNATSVFPPVAIANLTRKSPRFFFDFSDVSALINLEQNLFPLTQIRKTYQYWINNGTMGLDDGRILEGTATQCGFLTNIDRFSACMGEVLQTIQQLAGGN